MTKRWAVVVIDGNGEVVVMGAYRWRWVADLVKRSTKNVVAKHTIHRPGTLPMRLVVDVEHAGPRALGSMIRECQPWVAP